MRMPRKSRVIQSDVVYHVFNRRTDRQRLFPSSDAFEEFIRLMKEGHRRYRVRHCAFCLMDTHWHMALWPKDSTSMGEYLRWLCTTHAVRFRRQTGTRGNGHVYQDRYKSLPVRNFLYYATLIRYIEANPLNARLVRRAEDWRWSSLSERISDGPRLIESGPWDLPSDWLTIVNAQFKLIRLLPMSAPSLLPSTDLAEGRRCP